MRELEDLKWFPAFLRTHQTEYLAFLATRFKIYEPIKRRIEEKLSNKYPSSWTDTCSGKGGPVLALNINHETLLTDLYPPSSTEGYPPNITYHLHPIDISKEIPPGEGMVSMFNSFHHFNDKTKESIISNLASANRPFIISEILQPNLKTFLLVIFSTTIGHWLFVPFMKPFSLQRLIFTYLIPLHTLTVAIDGIISVCKSRSASYFKQLCNNFKYEKYSIQFHKTKGRFALLFHIEGAPIK